jgi:hypothetical protein
MRHTTLLGLLVLSFHASCTHSAAARPAPDDALLHMNHAFRGIYKEARSEAMQHVGPVIVTGGEEPITLVWNGKWTSASYIDPMTDKLKAMAHAPLTLTVAVQGDTSDIITLTDNKRAALQAYRDAFHHARDVLRDAGFNAAQLERQERIASAVESTLTALLHPEGMRRANFQAFAREMTPLVMQNVDDAAQLMLDQLNTIVKAWRAELGDNWKNTRVVLMAPHMPSRGLMQGQYFDRVFQSHGDEAHVIYMEGGGSTQAGLDLLATHLTDNAASKTFFDDPKRLHVDILADAATRYLDKMSLPAFP